MFTTYRHAEIPFEPLFGDHYQMWQYVEHRQHRPWFYVTVREASDGVSWDTMLLIPNEDAFESLLGEQSPDLQIASVALVVPARLNGTDSWSMEPLTELVKVHDQAKQVFGYEFKTGTIQCYVESRHEGAVGGTKARIYCSAAPSAVAES
ncbi:hypothetical protein ACQKFE_20575 [Stutzerimonas stutzeri]|uniref:Uncharacterized protein n=1 Tax=Stutzerimonas stutzeri TaxID=316 RepID=A0A6I6LUP7_STUST|nr:hypothetical protein [Stutzerimonas stutzeri]QGZ32953.1 hypothetical protein GQA94_22830 [Stutzerimonas stutzeri]